MLDVRRQLRQRTLARRETRWDDERSFADELMVIECLCRRLTVVGFDREEALQTDEVYLAVIEQARDEV